MNAVLEWINVASTAWWKYIVHLSWQAALVGVVLLSVVHLLGRRWPAPLRYALLVLALLKFACPPLLPVPTGLFAHFTPPGVILPTLQERKPAQASASQPFNPVEEGPKNQWLLERAQTFLLSVHWTAWLMLGHVTGTLLLLTLMLRQAASLRATARAARRLFGGYLGEVYRDLAFQLGLFRIPPLAMSDQVPGPMAFGVPKPAIMLPERIVHRLSAHDLKAVLAHELAHCRRGDLWLNWIQLVLLAVWWFNPILWLVHRSLRDVREDCCDDLLLVRGVISNDAYCDVLLRAAAEVASPASLNGSLPFGQRHHPLGRRLVRLTDWTLRRSENVSNAAAFAVLLAALLVLPGTQSSEGTAPAPSASVEPVVPPLASQVPHPRGHRAQVPRLNPEAETGGVPTASESDVTCDLRVFDQLILHGNWFRGVQGDWTMQTGLPRMPVLPVPVTSLNGMSAKLRIHAAY